MYEVSSPQVDPGFLTDSIVHHMNYEYDPVTAENHKVSKYSVYG